jgi:glyceraldehyde 3-phosphate dehydrogenase
MSRPIRIFIAGFGRIGRTILRQILSRHPTITVVGIADLSPPDMAAYLFRYDSVDGPWAETVESHRGSLRIGNRAIPYIWADRPLTTSLDAVDVVLECTGRTEDRDAVNCWLRAGARWVIVSGPSDISDATVVLGALENLPPGARIISNASCTTNAVAPLLTRIDADVGIVAGHVTTIHCTTGSQPTVDRPGGSWQRSRAAGESIIPTSTSALGQLRDIAPSLADRVTIAAARIPTISVSAIDAVLQLERWPPDLETFLAGLSDDRIIGQCDDPCVSVDFRGRTESLIIAQPETQTIAPRQLRLFGWYDNEAGYSARMIDVAQKLANT